MDIVKLLVPAMLAGLVAIFATVAIERWGGRVGGLLSTMPSTIVPASIGIYDQSATTALFEEAMYITPVGMFLSALFLWLWRVIPPRLPSMSFAARLAAMIVIALGAWMAAAIAVVLGVREVLDVGLSAAALGWVVLGMIIVVGVAACWKLTPAPRGTRKVAVGVLLARGGLAAFAILVALVFARVGGPLAAGVAAVFPAIFLTTMVALWVSQGEAVQAGAVGPMMLGSASVAAFSLIAAVTFPAFGVVVGCAMAWGGAVVCVTLPSWLWLRRRREA